MKLIKAVIQSPMLEDVKEALEGFGITGMTVFEVRGSGNQKGRMSPKNKSNPGINFVPKTHLEIVVEDALAEKVAVIIMQSARTGAIGDGKIFVLPVESCIRIRTGERGVDAIK